MKGILLVNMGGPENPKEVKEFLKLMFLDKHIIQAPVFIRKFLSLYISSTRYKKSWKRYQEIGGTPLKKNTNILALDLQKKLGNSFKIKIAYSYSNPFINVALNEFFQENIYDIIVIPLYPQRSITTTDSVIYDVEKAKSKNKSAKISFVKEFYKNPLYIKFWKDLIESHIEVQKLKSPTLVFSAHSIPKSFIKQGDTYQFAIEESAKFISESCKLPFIVSYQSGMNPKTWLGPNTKETIENLASKNLKEIIIIPISFISENLETLYDIDKFIVPDANKLDSDMKVSRIKIPVVNANLIQLFESLINH
ncbi:MAG: ferrochelatase [Bacteroidetes bacterium GWA2_30_7]|nr:MAG: ferrochelatase [Bacteroidetes bacterium GWA2_30_7]